MKRLLIIASMVILCASCQKGITPKEEAAELQSSKVNAIAALKANMSARSMNDPTEIQRLIQLWSQWAYGKPIAQFPNLDPTGALHDIGQCSSCGVYMLTGGSAGNPYFERSVTIDYAKYQYVFVPLVSITGWYDNCSTLFAPKGGQNQEATFNSMISPAFNGKHELTLMWDGQSLLSTKEKEYRANSGVFQLYLDPSFYPDCIAASSAAYSDGFWALLPITPGEHTLVVGGNFDWKKKFDIAAFNLGTYHITVINSAAP